MKILQRKKSTPYHSGFLDAKVDDFVDENGRVWVAVDDMIKVMKELQKIVLDTQALIQLQNIESAFKGLQINAKSKDD